MSALLQLVANRAASGAIQIADGVLRPDHFHNGLGFEPLGDLSVAVDGTIDHYHQGLPFTATGRLVVNALGVPTRFGSGAAPFGAAGRIVMTPVAPDHYSSGVAYGAGGAVASV